ncbi:MAG: hypothetical protein ACI8Z0_002214 [Lentimonas sp.]|jgi:hypothetical protein
MGGLTITLVKHRFLSFNIERDLSPLLTSQVAG